MGQDRWEASQQDEMIHRDASSESLLKLCVGATYTFGPAGISNIKATNGVRFQHPVLFRVCGAARKGVESHVGGTGKQGHRRSMVQGVLGQSLESQRCRRTQ